MATAMTLPSTFSSALKSMAQTRWYNWLYRVSVYALLCLLILRLSPFSPVVKPALQIESGVDDHPINFTSLSGSLLCPNVDGQQYEKCGDSCYLASQNRCDNGHIVALHADATGAGDCPIGATTLHLSDPPYENYIYVDCHATTQVVVTSPLPESDHDLVQPRLLVAWPAGNSGLLTYFAPANGVSGSLGITVPNSGSDDALQPIYSMATSDSRSGFPRVGVSGVLKFNSSAILTVPMLGSIRTMRDYTEFQSLVPLMQDTIESTLLSDGGARLSRVWLDNRTTTELIFTPVGSDNELVSLENGKLMFAPGFYQFTATYDYEQLSTLNVADVLDAEDVELAEDAPDQTKCLAFLTYSEKMLAGAWRFLTYFGRDSMITLLLLQPILSEGEGGAIEAVISSVLERINGTDGSACHEETIGDYATWLHMKNNVTSTAPLCAYHMVDTDYFLPIVMQNYLVETEVGRERASPFLAHKASLPFGNEGVTYSALALRNAEKIMDFAAPFAAPGGQKPENMQHLLPGEPAGEWRDSDLGIGNGRIPFDINTALIPASLRAISALSSLGIFPSHPEWSDLAASYAQIWEDSTLDFFSITESEKSAKFLVETYAAASEFSGSSHADDIDAPLTYYAISIGTEEDEEFKIPIMNTDTSFRLYLLNSTNDEQLTALLNATANSILLPYPAGLLTDIGLLVANPAYAMDTIPSFVDGFGKDQYHGVVVWGWPMAMMAAALERQLGRCEAAGSDHVPAFCSMPSVYDRVRAAYNQLWDVLGQIKPLLNQEVWTWSYGVEEGYKPVPLGTYSNVESDVVQLWSLAYLAVTRNEALR